MIDKALLAKIRKCLSLAKSANEHEAATALAKARALMAEHGVTDEQLALADIEEATARASRTQKPPKWENYLCRAVERALRVQSFITAGGDRQFIGRGAAPEIASYAFAVLFRKLKAARADYISTQLKRCKPGRKRQRADIFCEAWAFAVFSKIEALLPEAPEDAGIGQYLAVRYPHLATVTGRSASMKGRSVWDDHRRGRMAGGAVDLHQGVGGVAPQLLS